MRIAYVSCDLGVPIFGRKGCSIHAQEILRAMLRRGADVDLFTPRGEGERPEDLEPVLLHELPCPPKGDAAAREQAARKENATLRTRLANSGPFDLVYERYSLWSFAAMEFARDHGMPRILEVNAPLIEEQAEYRVLIDRAGAEQSAERAFAAAAALVCVSDEMAACLERFDAARGKVHVIPNGVRPERFAQPVKKALPAPQGEFTVGFVGTLKRWHGVSILIDAFALLRARQPASRLLIVGDGPERETLEAQVANIGLQGAIHFTGAVAPDAVPGLLASMDAAVAPYPKLPHFYFSPLKVYEYMAAGVPVVASRTGQLEKLIEPDVNGLLVPPGDAAALADALERLLIDPDLRVRLGAAGRDLVLRQYTWDRAVHRILTIAGLN